ncbi:hypothetical protein ACIQZB_17660 [Streptomyces sp. NPDC097727]
MSDRYRRPHPRRLSVLRERLRNQAVSACFADGRLPSRYLVCKR